MDWLDKIPELLRMTWADLSKVAIGIFLFGFTLIAWARNAIKAAREKSRADLNEKIAECERKVAESERRHSAEITDQSRRHGENTAHLHETITALRAESHEMKAERDTCSAEADTLRGRIAELKTFDGKLWDRTHLAEPPAFVAAGERKTKFIAVANLKGGVGKTTIAANAGMALAKLGHNVLLVDLDFQGSLTRLCTDFKSLRERVRRKDTVGALFDWNTPPADILTRIIGSVSGTPTNAGACDFIAAFDDLADIELREEARWFIARQPDVRFVFRRAFQTPKILSRYDHVIFDCPPRLGTACVNALACSDWLLVPVVLDQQSVQALPRTFGWVRRLQLVTNARLLGIVANQVKVVGNQLVAAQQTLYNQLPDFLNRSGYQMNGAFLAVVKADNAVIAKAANDARIAAADPAGARLFEQLVSEISKATK